MFGNPIFKISAFLSLVLILVASVITIATSGNSASLSQTNAAVNKKANLPPFIAALDTQVASRDDEAYAPYTKKQIDAIITAAKSLGINYLTVDTDWDYQYYLQTWVQEIHNNGLSVWLKSSPINWTAGSQFTTNLNFYLDESKMFLQENKNIFQKGDIIDLFPNPTEHWDALKVPGVVHTIADYNNFFIDVSMQINDELGQQQVVNAIHTQDFQTAQSPLLFYPNTANILGTVSIDSLPTTQTLASDITAIHNNTNQPIIISDAGESLNLIPDSAGKEQFFKTELTNLLLQKSVIGYCYILQANNTETDPVRHFFYTQINGSSTFSPYLNALHDFFQEAALIH